MIVLRVKHKYIYQLYELGAKGSNFRKCNEIDEI